MSDTSTQGRSGRTPGTMLQSIATVSGISGVAMVVSFFMTVAIAAIIGAAADKDAYDVAAYLPQAMLFMFGLDLFRGIAISLFSRLDVSRTEDPAKVFSSLINVVTLASIIVIIIAEIFVAPLIKIIGPGLGPQTAQLAVQLARFLIPTLGLIVITGLMGSILLAHHYYGLTEALAALPKLAMLIGVLLWGKTLGVWVLVFAMITGLLAKLPIMLYFLYRCGLRYSPVLEIKSPVIKSAILDAIPIAISSSIIYFSGIFMQRTVSYGDAGTIACFNYSLILCSALTALVSKPVFTALAPRISRSLEEKDYDKSSRMLAKSFGLVTLICLAGISAVGTHALVVVDIILGRGRFNPEAVEQTSKFLRIVFPTVLAIGIRMSAVTVLLALRRTKTIMLFCILAGAVRVVLAVAGRHWWGVYASPIAYLGAAVIDGLLCFILAVRITRLYKKMANFRKACHWLMGCIIAVVLPMTPHLFHPVNHRSPFITKILQLVIVCLVSAVALVLAAWVSRLHTIRQTLHTISKNIQRFRPKK